MNRRLASRLLTPVALAAVCSVARLASAPDTPLQDKRTVLDLKYPSEGLRQTVLDLATGAQDITTKVQDLTTKVQDLKAKVQDLKVEETNTEIRIELAADVLFDFDKAEIRPAAQKALAQAAALIRDKGGKTLRIEGHTDAKGSDDYNQRLSTRRAQAVQAWLIEKEKLGDRTFTAEGFAARKPVAPNTKPDGSDDPEGRQKNRRVEIIVKKR